MLDFTELAPDGNDLERLAREILFGLGYRPYWTGKGQDRGRDLVFVEEFASMFAPQTRKWLVSCKHNAHSGNAVSVNDLGEIVDTCAQHEAQAYLLVCSTYPSSAVVDRLNGISTNQNSILKATYWDSVIIERHLSTPRLWTLAQHFFPRSAAGWKIYATERPNRWVANYEGFYFHLATRIGSNCDFLLEQIAALVAAMESVQLPDKHHLRLRAVYYDDKNGNYHAFVDYLVPSDEQPFIGKVQLTDTLLNASYPHGNLYGIDLAVCNYTSASDHFDLDHYDYYQPYLANFQSGIKR